MLTCIVGPKQQQQLGNNNSLSQHDHDSLHTPNSKQSLKSITKIKEMAMKASGAYKCSQDRTRTDLEMVGSGSVRNPWSYRRTTSVNSSSASSRWGKELEERLKGISVGGGGGGVVAVGGGRKVEVAAVGGGRKVEVAAVVVVDESEPKEWVAQVEPGVLITFVSLPRGGNDLKRIRFSRDMFNKWQAQKWWTENYEKVMELYNVKKLSRQAFSLPTSISDDENSKRESIGDNPSTPPLTKENLPRSLYGGTGMRYSSSDSFEQQSKISRQYNDSSGLASTPKNSSISGATAKTEASSMDESMRSTSSRDAEELSVSNASDMETEWVEEDEPGVYITIRALPGGRRELRRVRFSREKFGEMHARVWWEENRARIHEQYL